MTLRVASFHKTSFNNFYGSVCSAAFISGCNLRCPYCHNKWLIENKEKDKKEEFLAHLKKREGLITLAVVSGGEPTLHKDLPDFIREIKKITPRVKLDTNGTRPEMIARLIGYKLVDYFAMDIKGPPSIYKSIFGFAGDENEIRASIAMIQNSGINHEFRVTVANPFIGEEEIKEIVKLVNPENLIIQPFKYDGEILDNRFAKENDTPTFDYMNKLNIICEGKAFVRTFWSETTDIYGSKIH